MELYRPQEAARVMGVSYQTLKLWIYNGKIRSIKTPGGHHRIPRSEVERLAQTKKLVAAKHKSSSLDDISGRNKLPGTIIHIKFSGLLAQVTMDVCGNTITAIITRDACEALKLKKGVQAYALIKATEVMVIRG
jgi:molybdopterin-binding protein